MKLLVLVAAIALVNTNTASAAAMLTWIFFDAARGKKPSAVGASIGLVVGLVAITPAAGFVNVGTDHDTGAFAVASIRGWWRFEGRHLYPGVNQIVITADGGGSNGSRLRLWKLELQYFANETGLSLSICHFPPGTSKWNKIEHRLFSFISSNWRCEPLRDYETIVNLIANTTTAKGLVVKCRLDRRKYPLGRKVSDQEMRQVNLERNRFHGDWNYVIKPNANS